MTRAKEITKEAKKFAKEIDDWEIAEDVQDAFEQGAQWADRTMIDKAVDWFEKHLPQCIEIEENYVVVNYGLIADFEEAMKGGSNQ